MPEIPIIDTDGNLRLRAGLWTMCYMVFSECEDDAIRAGDCLFSENESMEAGRQEDYGEVGKAIHTLMLRRMTNARIAGQVFYQMLLNAENRGAPDFRKAVFSVSEWASQTKTKKGKPLPASGDNIRKHFHKFRSAITFWAAFDLMSHDDQTKLFDSEGGAFFRFLLAVAALENKANSLRLASGTEALAGWNPWLVPTVFHAAIDDGRADGVAVVLPEETDAIRERIAHYVNKPFENPSG